MSEFKKYVITEEVKSYDAKSEFMVELVDKFRGRLKEKVDKAFEGAKKSFIDGMVPSYDREFYADMTKSFQEALEADYYSDDVSVVDKDATALQRLFDEKVGELKAIAYNFEELVSCMDGVQISANIATTNYLNKKTDDIKRLLEAYKNDRD